MKFLHCPRTSGEALFEILMDFMAKKGIPMENGRGQRYDGGGNMIGKHKGLQARVTRAYPKMHYHWCDAHCLNLCIGKACEEHSESLLAPLMHGSSTAQEIPACTLDASTAQHIPTCTLDASGIYCTANLCLHP